MSAVGRTANDGYTPGSGLPLGVPPGSHSEDSFTKVRGELQSSREPNTPVTPLPEVPTSASARASRRVGRLQLSDLVDRLSERDWEVLRLVAAHRFLTTHQVQHLCFIQHQTEATGARVTRRVLGRLGRDGLVRPLDRRVGGFRAGSAATIWQLTPAGSRALHGDEKRRRSSAPSERFLRHCLAIADVHVLLEQHRRIEPVENVVVEVEPASWRRYQGPGGEPRWLQPDLFAEITTTEFVDRIFIEVDLGTESLPTLIGKCQQYEEYRRTGIEQTRAGGFPVVVWFVLTAARADRLHQAIRRSGKLTEAMYRVATPRSLTQVLAGGPE